MSPQRMQMTRLRPWRHRAPDAVIVDRRSMWGNPFKIGENYMWLSTLPFPVPTAREPGDYEHGLTVDKLREASDAVEWFRAWATWSERRDGYLAAVQQNLEGKDLACWCPLDQPCHADVLLELANGGTP
jgi:hypothetical protein